MVGGLRDRAQRQFVWSVGTSDQKSFGSCYHIVPGSRPALAIETLTAGTRNHSRMTDAVDAEEIRHVADLARLDLADDEVGEFVDQFGAILEHFEQLEEVPEVDADPDLVNVMRPDEVEESLTQAEALANAEETEDGRFKGPNVS
jgi:aspartyl-tRNA(Asn)/glutamyl-tRNA(Gln) amidotransferase subunit C